MISSDSQPPNPREKRWYIYSGSSHHGPFDLGEVGNRLRDAKISHADHIWTEGMTDWCEIQKVEGLQLLLMQHEFLPTEREESPQTVNLAVPQAIARDRVHDVFEPEAETKFTVPPQFVESAPPVQRSKFRFILTAAAVAVTLAALVVVQRSLQNPLAPIRDISPADFNELSAAAGSSLQRHGAIAALARSQDSIDPLFYVGTNLPDGTRLDVQIEGLPETLVGKFRVSVHAGVVVRGALAVTPEFLLADGAKIPRGEYKVSISCSDCPMSNGARGKGPMVEKTFFLGGTKDANYQKDLVSYHLLLRERAQAELSEIHQISETLEHQLAATNERFNSLLQRKASARSRPWQRFDEQWSGLQSQLNDMTGSWSAKSFANDFLHPELYMFTQQAERLIDHIHSEQAAALDKDDEEAKTKILADISIAQSTLLSIRTKTTLLERSVPTGTGLPQEK